MKNLTTISKTRRLMLILAIAVMLSATMTLSVAFAGGADAGGGSDGSGTTSNISDGIFSGLEGVYSIINSIALPIAGLCLAFCAFKIWMGGERGMETAKRVGIYTIIALALVYLAPTIVKAVSTWFSGNTGFSELKGG